MNTSHPALRRMLAAALAGFIACGGLAACSRTSKSFAPAAEAAPTWSGTVSHLFADRSVGTKPNGCTSCHHAGTTLPDWTDYATVVANELSIRSCLGTAGNGYTDGEMSQFTTPADAAVIVDWFDNGHPF